MREPLAALPAALSLSPSQWPSHPHFPAQTLLLRSHESFRRTSQTLVQRAQAGRDAQAIGWVFGAWKSAMKNHEAYEEYKLYPYLEMRWGLDMDPAEQGHHALGLLDAQVRQAVKPGDATPALTAALTQHHDALLAHLDLEERLVIPALLALTPQEFERYSRSTLSMLLRDPHPTG